MSQQVALGMIFLDTFSRSQERSAHWRKVGRPFLTTQTLQVRKAKDPEGEEAPRHKVSGRTGRACPGAVSCRSVALGSYLDVEDVVKNAVELLIQQRLDFILQVALSFFVVFAGVQA